MKNKVLNIIVITIVSILLLVCLGITIYNKIEENKKKYSYEKLLEIYNSIKYDDKVNVYLFHGEDCPHCKEELKFFNNLDNDIKSKFNFYKFETWYNENNRELKKKIIDLLVSEGKIVIDENSDMTIKNYYDVVPFLIIGDQYIIGYKNTIDEDIKSTILNSNTSYDIMKKLNLK